jgi:hypothetical protein
MNYRRKVLGSLRCRIDLSGPLGRKITIQRVDRCVKNEVAVRASFKMALDLFLDRSGKSAL